jgi:YVTN family beta-propeller protein
MKILLVAILLCGGSLLATANRAYVLNEGDGTISIIDTSTSQPDVIGTINIGGFPLSLAISPDGRYLYTTELGSHSLKIIDTTLSPPSVVYNVQVGFNPQQVALTPNSHFAYVTNAGSNSVSVVDTTTLPPSVLYTVSVGIEPNGITISPDGHFAYVANLSVGSPPGSITIIDTTTNPPSVLGSPIDVGTNPSYIAVTQNGRYVYVTDETDSQVIVIDMSTNPPSIAYSIPIGAPTSGIEIFGNLAYVAVQGTSIQVIDTTLVPPSVVNVIPLPFEPVQLALTPDGSSIYITSYFPPTSGYAVVNLMTAPPGVSGPFPLGSGPDSIVISQSAASPANFSGIQKKNDFGTLSEYFNSLTWSRATASNVAGYYLYRNGQLLKTLSSTAVSYKDENRNPKAADTYSLVTFSANGVVNAIPSTIVVGGR